MKKNIFCMCFLLNSMLGQFELAVYRGNGQVVSGEKRITILTTSYKNADWYQKNLDSIFSQQYSNYRLIYIDDCSPDNTGKLVEDYIKKCQPKCDVILIKNKVRVTALLNLYRAIHMADPGDILITVDGDDWLARDHVLSKINKLYDDPHVWLTYGQFQEYPSGKCGFCRAYPDKITKDGSYRQHQCQPSHLRTFYAWLAQLIKAKDLFYENLFYPMTYDLALTMSMMDMAGIRHKFVSDIMYIYNEQTPINDHKVSQELQHKFAQIIRASPRYELLPYSYEFRGLSLRNAQAALLVLSVDNPDHLGILLNSLELYARNLLSGTILYSASKATNADQYQKLSTKFPRFKFIATEKQHFLTEGIKAIFSCSQEYVALFFDDFILNKEINFNECI
jgi:glycosyltransferase involved in cell wall biosynthesis